MPRSELLHGYEIEKGQYVLVDDDDMKSVRLESTKTIQIERFVDASAIDRLYWESAVLRGALGQEGPAGAVRGESGTLWSRPAGVALGRVVMGGRERIVAIEPRHGGLLLSTLHAKDEVRADSEVFGGLEGDQGGPGDGGDCAGDHRQAGRARSTRRSSMTGIRRRCGSWWNGRPGMRR